MIVKGIATAPAAKSADAGNAIIGGHTVATGAGAADLTATGSVFFGTGGSYKVTNAGAALLATSTVWSRQPEPMNSSLARHSRACYAY